MKLWRRLTFAKEHMVPIHYHELLQGFLYNSMKPELARLIHNKGIQYKQRTFRFVTFSRLIGEYHLSKDKRWIQFPTSCTLVVSSPLHEVLRSVMTRLLKNPIINIGFNKVAIDSIKAEILPQAGSSMRVRTLSPVVAYNTMTRLNGRKFTLYRSPDETEFSRLVYKNLQKKVAAFALWKGSELPHILEEFHIHATKFRLHVLKYQDIVIKGYSGTFMITGDSRLLTMGLEAGLGSKNSQGFGCVEAIGPSMASRRRA